MGTSRRENCLPVTRIVNFRYFMLTLLFCLGGCGSALEGRLTFTSSYDGILYVSKPDAWGQTARVSLSYLCVMQNGFPGHGNPLLSC